VDLSFHNLLIIRLNFYSCTAHPITELGLLKAFQHHPAANVGFLPPSWDYGSQVHPDHGSLFSPPPVLNKFSQLSVDLNILAHPEWVLL